MDMKLQCPPFSKMCNHTTYLLKQKFLSPSDVLIFSYFIPFELNLSTKLQKKIPWVVVYAAFSNPCIN
jgi:hypothetical protein